MSEWIRIKTRPLTEDEKKDLIENKAECAEDLEQIVVIDCPLPKDDQEVLITVNGYVTTDTFSDDGDHYFFNNYDLEEISAWMPMPEPFKMFDYSFFENFIHFVEEKRDKKITNMEKFEEIFGFSLRFKTPVCPVGDFDCKGIECRNCPFSHEWWAKEYKPCFKLKGE